MVQKLALIGTNLCSNVIHYINVVMIRMIEITLRECRFGGSENALIITRILYIIMRWRKERVCSIVIMISEHTQSYRILYKSITVEKENNCEEASMYAVSYTHLTLPTKRIV